MRPLACCLENEWKWRYEQQNSTAQESEGRSILSVWRDRKVFKFLYYATATVCGIVGIPMLLASIVQSIRDPNDWSLAPAGILFGGLLTLASYFLFAG